MNDNDFVNKLLNLDKVQVIRTEFGGDDEVTLFVESAHEIAVCPGCKQVSNSVHDLSEEQMIRDLSIVERRCYLSYRARRFDCRTCSNTFVERMTWKRPGLKPPREPS